MADSDSSSLAKQVLGAHAERMPLTDCCPHPAELCLAPH